MKKKQVRKKRVAYLAGDAGGVACGLPTMRELEKICDVTYFAAALGAGKDTFRKADIEPILWVEKAFLDFVGYDLIVCATAGKPEGIALLRAATAAAKRDGVRCVWIGDSWISGTEPAVADIAPDDMIVISQSSKDQFIKVHPTFDKKRITVAGNPDFDFLGSFNRSKVRALARAKLGIADSTKVIVYSSSSLTQYDAASQFKLLHDLVEKSGASLILTFHPADKSKKDVDIANLRGFFKLELGDRYIEIPDGVKITNEELAALADVFLTDYSITGTVAFLMGTPTCFIMLAGGAQEYQKSRGLTFPYLPFLDEGKTGMETTAAVPIFSTTDARARFDLLWDPHEQAERELTILDHYDELRDGGAKKRTVQALNAMLG